MYMGYKFQPRNVDLNILIYLSSFMKKKSIVYLFSHNI